MSSYSIISTIPPPDLIMMSFTSKLSLIRSETNSITQSLQSSHPWIFSPLILPFPTTTLPSEVLITAFTSQFISSNTPSCSTFFNSASQIQTCSPRYSKYFFTSSFIHPSCLLSWYPLIVPMNSVRYLPLKSSTESYFPSYFWRLVENQQGFYFTFIPIPICPMKWGLLNCWNYVLINTPDTFRLFTNTSFTHFKRGLSCKLFQINLHVASPANTESTGMSLCWNEPRMVMYMFPGGLSQVFVLCPCPCDWDLEVKTKYVVGVICSLGKCSDTSMVDLIESKWTT